MNYINEKYIDVILPIYKSNFDDLSKCLDSLNKQTYKKFNITIIEDPSAEDTSYIEELIKETYNLNLNWIRNEDRKGLAESLNIGIKQGKSEYIARVDSDDICNQFRFEKQIKYFEEHSNVSIVGSWMREFNNNDKKDNRTKIRKYPFNYEDIKKKIMWYNPIAHPTVMMKREIFDQIGYYKTNLESLEDWELWVRAINNNVSIINIPECLVEYQIENNSIVETNIRKIILDQIKFKKYLLDNCKNHFSIIIFLNILILGCALIIPKKLIQKLYYKIVF